MAIDQRTVGKIAKLARLSFDEEEKGVVAHRSEGRAFIYRPALAESDVREGMVGYVVQRMFAGDGAALVNHLIEAGEVDAAELEALRARLSDRRAKR